MAAQYQVTLARTTWQLAFVHVQADNHDQAEATVKQMIADGNLPGSLAWSIEQIITPAQVLLAKEVSE